ncbi:MAG: DUF3099 domain-containing protein [Pseudonocardiaceae bacterium]
MRDSNAEARGARNDTPVLITEAAPSYADQYARRRRKYAILMSARIPCLVLAGVFYQTWWLALGFVILSVPLPWVAVLIANDRPPRKAEDANRYRARGRALEAREHYVIDS